MTGERDTAALRDVRTVVAALWNLDEADGAPGSPHAQVLAAAVDDDRIDADELAARIAALPEAANAPAAWVGNAIILASIGRWRDAARLIRDNVEAAHAFGDFEGSAYAYAGGVVCKMVGDLEGAEEQFRGAIYLDGSVPDYSVQLARLLLDANRGHDALEVVDAALARRSDARLASLRSRIARTPARPG